MELVFNIWFIVDIGTELTKYAITKPYCLFGTEDEKLLMLNILAESDYLTSERYDFAEGSFVIYNDKVCEGYLTGSEIESFIDSNIDFFFR